MSKAVSGALSFDKDDEDAMTDISAETTGGDKETRWEVVTKTAGLPPAQIIAGRLQSEGIPARAWQEGAGQAFGLTIGLLGTGYVEVPEAYVEKAKEILAVVYDEDSFDDESYDDDQADESQSA
jgi:hypothetical protein